MHIYVYKHTHIHIYLNIFSYIYKTNYFIHLCHLWSETVAVLGREK